MWDSVARCSMNVGYILRGIQRGNVFVGMACGDIA